MKAGDVTWTKAREVVKVATPDTEAGWVERAEGLTTRELQRVVKSKQRGDDAPGPEEPLPPEPVVLRFEFDEAQAAFVRKAMAVLRSRAQSEIDSNTQPGEPLDDAAVLTLMAERVVADPDGAGELTVDRFQTVLRKCPDCELTTHADSGRSDQGPVLEVDPTTQACAECDSVVVDLRPESGQMGRATRTVTKTTRRIVLDRDGRQCAVPGCRNGIWLQLQRSAGARSRREGRMPEQGWCTAKTAGSTVPRIS